MKHILFIIISAFLFSCHTDGPEDSTPPAQDTLVAQASPPATEGVALDSIMSRSELVNAPFHQTDEMVYFRKIMAKRTERKVELKSNLYDEGVTDTITTLYWGKSYIETTSNTSIKTALLNYAIINDNNLVLKNNIRIGQDLKTVCEALHLTYDRSKTYKFIELVTPDDAAESFLTFYFKNNILESIIYSPYTG